MTIPRKPFGVQAASVETDFLILGGGVAGLQAAIALAGEGQVTLLSKGTGRQGSSLYAQGGIAVALNGSEDEEVHYRDTLKAGAGLCREEAVRILVREGPERVRNLIAWGARFDRKGKHYLLAKEASHSRPRILRAKGDRTGEEIVRTLSGRLKRSSTIRSLDRHFTVDLIIRDGACLGVLALDERNGLLLPVLAKATILATGGAGAIYLRTTNPPTATGDGLAMAYRAGALLEDMEFLQFHPTALCLSNAPPFLITEALRGEGAVLTNHKGEAFMARYHPDADLAPRDVVSRAIQTEMDRERASYVYLDTARLEAGFLKKRFPTIYRTCRGYGIDFTREPIPVSPAAHFLIGGVKTDLQGETSLAGLYAVGEVACTQVHGANRLGSNSLLEGLVFGARAGTAAARYARRVRPGKPASHDALSRPGISDRIPDGRAFEIQKAVRRLMWEGAGLIRTEESLQKAFRRARTFVNEVKGPQASRVGMETANMATAAMLIAWAALQRRGSIGTHFRADAAKGGGRESLQHRAFHIQNLPGYGKAGARRPSGAG